ncbi:M23 family peptidase [Salipaludibacillus sp. HK11]|uniref:M23 family peptidase n=1 Tax=Salipaludibacillus sp. HK11 TaxID=3394320 RepID=UPI0039FCA3A7
MWKVLILMFAMLSITACELEATQEELTNSDNSSEETEVENLNNNDQGLNENDHLEEKNEEIETHDEEVEVYSFDDTEEHFIAVEELTEIIGGRYDYDEIDKSLTISISGREFYLVYGVPVLEIDGVYKDSDRVLVKEDEEGKAYVTKSFVEEGLEMDYEFDDEESVVTFSWTDEVVQAWASFGQEEVDIHSFSTDDMIDYLSFLDKPIEGASVSTVESHLPGAPRDYRNGTHEGIDWYDYASGIEISTDTPIYAMAEGVVVRVDDDFEDYSSHEVRDYDLNLASEVGFTPEYIFDKLRGMQVWVQYDNGVMNRFAHLDSIPEDLELGQTVTEETVIGYVGNSGTSGALNQDNSGLHLHQDLLIYGELFWEPFTLDETASILQELWP